MQKNISDVVFKEQSLVYLIVIVFDTKNKYPIRNIRALIKFQLISMLVHKRYMNVKIANIKRIIIENLINCL